MKWVLLPSTVLIRRNILDDVGEFNEDLHCVEDYEFFMRILAHYPLAVVNNVLMRYRLHQGNTHRDIALMRTNLLRYFDIVTTSPERYPIGAFKAAVKGRSSLLQSDGQLYGYQNLAL